GVAQEASLDLGREDVLAAGDDHVVVAAVDVQPPLRVEVTDAASAQQAVDDVLPATARVSLKRRGRADEDPAGRAARRRATLVVEQSHPRAEGWTAHSGRRVAEIGRRRQ